MSFLLMQYEYQKANRKVSYHESRGIRINNEQERVTKRVEKLEKIYSKKQTQIEQYWANEKSSINTSLTNKGQSAIASISTSSSTVAGDSSTAQVQSFSINVGNIFNIPIGPYNLSQFITLDLSNCQTAQQALGEIQTAIATAQTIVSTLIQQLQDAETDELEAEEDEVQLPLTDKDSELTIEASTNDILLEAWTTRRDNAKQRLSSDIESSMAGYGLR